MADSSVAVTQGSGTAIDTFTQSDGSHRQALVIGDPALSYVARVGSEGGLWVVPRGGVRNNVTIGYEAIAPGASDAIVTPTFITRNGTETTSSPVMTVTSGYTFRVQSIVASITLVGTTVSNARIRLRYNPSGAATTASARAMSWRIGNWTNGTQAANYTQQSENLVIPDGMEFNAATGLGVSMSVTTASMLTVDLIITGYEYPNIPS